MPINHSWFSKEIQTTDATPTAVTAAAVTIPDGNTAIVQIRAIAKRSTGDTKTFTRQATYKRATGQSTTIVGAIADMLPALGDAGAATWAIATEVNSNAVRPIVTGQAGATITWTVDFQVWVQV